VQVEVKKPRVAHLPFEEQYPTAIRTFPPINGKSGGIRIFIGGPELIKWRTAEQIQKARNNIMTILIKEVTKQTAKKHNIQCADTNLKLDSSLVTVLSAYRSVGEERLFCVNCDEWLSKDPMVALKHGWKKGEHRTVKVFDKAGVETWVKQICAKLGIKVELHPAEREGWENAVKCKSCGKEYEYPVDWENVCSCNKGFCFLKGYRHINVGIAQITDVGYAIESANSCGYCGGKDIFHLFGIQRPKITHVRDSRKEDMARSWISSDGLEVFLGDTSDYLHELAHSIHYQVRDVTKIENILGISIGTEEDEDVAEVIEKVICKFCEGDGGYSNATWTIRQMENLGKEVHKIVIE